MITNESCTTFYRDKGGSYSRTFYPAAFWQDTYAESLMKYGKENASKALVLIPLTEQKPRKGAYILRGRVSENVTDETLGDFLKRYEAFTIEAVEEKNYGSSRVQHWEVAAK